MANPQLVLRWYKVWASLPDEKRDTHFVVHDRHPMILGDHNCCILPPGVMGYWSQVFRDPNFDTETGIFTHPKEEVKYELHPYAKQDREVMALAYPNG